MSAHSGVHVAIRQAESRAQGLHEATEAVVGLLGAAASSEAEPSGLDGEAACILAGSSCRERHQLDLAWVELEQALARVRGRVIHCLVDERGMSFTQVARLLSLSRQSVTRSYKLPE